MKNALADRLESMQLEQDEWNESEEGQEIAAMGEALGDGEIDLSFLERKGKKSS